MRIPISPSNGAHKVQPDRRRQPRSLPVIGAGRPTIGTRVGLVEDANELGAAVRINIGLDVGDSVPVKFHGRPVFGARIVWKRGAKIGLAFSSRANT